MSLQTPSKIRTLQRKLYRKAKDEPAYRFLYLDPRMVRTELYRQALRTNLYLSQLMLEAHLARLLGVPIRRRVTR